MAQIQLLKRFSYTHYTLRTGGLNILTSSNSGAIPGANTVIRMRDIAAEAGFSQSTVSYVLNGRAADMRICEETQRRIFEVAADLGYRRNEVARTMVTGRSQTFAFMTQGPSDELAIRIMVGAQEEADEHGYIIKLFPVTPRMNFQTRIDRCMEQRIAGVLAVNITPESLQYLHSETRRFGVPAALIDDAPAEHDAIRIVADNDLGVRQAIEHLEGLGHRHIAFVAANAGSPPSEARRKSFQATMRERSLPLGRHSVIQTNWHDGAIIEKGVLQLMSRPGDAPTALLCAGDKIALVVQRALRKIGCRVPDDISVVGYANFQMSLYADPPLTTVGQPFEEMGRLAVRHILERIGDPEITEPIDLELPTHLVIRESTAPARVGKLAVECAARARVTLERE